MPNRILLCTSPLQVVNARSVMDYMGSSNGYNDYVIMIHPLLLDSTKSMIREIANKLGYTGVLDLTSMSQDLDVLNRGNEPDTLKEKIYSLTIGAGFNKKFDNYKYIQKKIRNLTIDKIDRVDILFYRMMYKKLDALFIRAFRSAKKKIGIEDGIGDYLPKYWEYKTFNRHEILHTLKSLYHNNRSFLLSLTVTGKLNESRMLYLRPNIPWDESFTNIQFGENGCVGKYFIQNIKKLYVEKPVYKQRKVLIFGSLVPDPRYKMDIMREVEIYNAVITIIIKKHKVSNSEIWYKPHPRLDFKSWVYKKNLNCNIYDYNDSSLGDVELCNHNIRAVYSVGSTSLLCAKVLFNIDSYLIDIRNEQVHPSTYKKYYDIAAIFGIRPIRVG